MPEAYPLLWNPQAGGGRMALALHGAKAALGQAGVPFAPVMTEGPGKVAAQVEALADEHDVILALGGDGTVSEVAQGAVAARRRPHLGFIPGGTGNDFLRDFGVTDTKEAVRRIARGATRSVDAASVEGPFGRRVFVNMLGAGFIAAAGARAARYKWLGRRAYGAAVVREVMGLRPQPTRLQLDGESIDSDCAMVAICNTIHTGGAMKMAPDARVDDGRLDIVWTEGIERLEVLRLLPKIFHGAHVGHAKVRVQTASRIRLRPAVDGPLLVDGDVVGRTPIDVRVMPGALSCLL